LHSKAVDYVKTGQSAEIPKRLKCARWPHFMEKRFSPKERQYHSTKILGQLYDKVESVDFKPMYEEPFDKRILRAYKHDDGLLKKVRKVKSQYDNAMRRIMAQQEIQTEFEVWTTFVLSKPRVGTDYKQQEEMGHISEALKDRFRLICIEQAGVSSFAILGPWVAAMYKITKEELDIALAECRSTKIVGGQIVPKRKMDAKYMPLISFPWLFEKELGRIATGIDSSDEFDAIIPSLATNKDVGQQKVAIRGDLIELDDFIYLEDGKTVHRGEELNLFGPDDTKNSYAGEDDQDEVRSVRDFKDGSEMTGETRKVIFDTSLEPRVSIPDHLLSGTGIEDLIR
jgi:RNA-dependent RNA polymerase